MKAFFEEYGFVILSAVVVITLIVIAGNVKANVQEGITEVITGFKTQVTNNLGKVNINQGGNMDGDRG